MAWPNSLQHPVSLFFRGIISGIHTCMPTVLAKLIVVAISCMVIVSCDKDEPTAILATEIDMLGHRHDLKFRGDTLVGVIYSTFITRSETDTARIDTLIRRDVDSLVYESNQSISLLRKASRHSASGKVHRRFYFNADNLLSRITRFDGNVEYTTDSVTYDYTSLKAYYYDLVNHELEELEYDRDNNITSIIEKRTGTNQVIASVYNYFTESRDPFLINLNDDQQAFGCFHRKCVGLFWYGGMRPQFRSVNNVQATKQVRNKEESNALFEYHTREGLPVARYGGYGVVFYRYSIRN
jgi:hypothetical protein